jgi:CheY-like chemotaxis protein
MMNSRQFVILLAEDEMLVRSVVRAMLNEAGYFVLEAVDGEHALEVSRKYDGAIHLLLTDVKMPGMDGLELTHHITRERPGIKVLVMSGKTSGELRYVGKSVPLLRKPFLPKTLWETMHNLLDGVVE